MPGEAAEDYEFRSLSVFSTSQPNADFRCEVMRDRPWHAFQLLRAEAWAAHTLRHDEKKCGIRSVITKTETRGPYTRPFTVYFVHTKTAFSVKGVCKRFSDFKELDAKIKQLDSEIKTLDAKTRGHRGRLFYGKKHHFGRVVSRLHKLGGSKPVMLVIGRDKSASSATSCSAELMRHLTQNFLAVFSSEWGSSKFCPGHGGAFKDNYQNTSDTTRSKTCTQNGCQLTGRHNRDLIAPLSILVIWLHNLFDVALPDHFTPPWKAGTESLVDGQAVSKTWK